jgi:hypothetical protein
MIRGAILVLAVTIGACGRAPGPEVHPEPEPPPAPLDGGVSRLRVCVVRGASLAEVEAEFHTQTGDTLVNGLPFREAYPAEPPAYASTATWAILYEPLVFRRHRYIRYGLPREIRRDLLEHVGEYSGTPLFREAGESGVPDVLYVPFSTGCVFQPYENTTHGGAVRG